MHHVEALILPAALVPLFPVNLILKFHLIKKATFNVVANIYDGSGTIDVYYTEGSKSENFTIIKSAVPIPDTGLINVTVTMPEEYVGTSGIIQVVFNSDETFYQCSDVNVVQDTNSASGVVTAMTLLSVLIALLL